MIILTMSHQTTNRDDLYLNDFHRKWDEECEKENARVRSMYFSAEYLRAQSQRMNELVQKQREELRRKRKNSSKGGQYHW